MFNQDLICLVLFHIKVNSCFLTVVITSELMRLITAACVCLCSLHPISGTGHIISYADFFSINLRFGSHFLNSCRSHSSTNWSYKCQNHRAEKKRKRCSDKEQQHHMTFIFVLVSSRSHFHLIHDTWFTEMEKTRDENIIIARKCFRT